MNVPKFIKWLALNGAEILPLSNEYEAVRFKGKEVGVLYKSGKTSNKYTRYAVSCFKQRIKWDGRPIKTGRRPTYKKEKIALIKRDGTRCFFCGKELEDDITLEHLIALNNGGLNNLSNMVLMHEKCNNDLGHKPLIEKINLVINQRIKANENSNNNGGRN